MNQLKCVLMKFIMFIVLNAVYKTAFVACTSWVYTLTYNIYTLWYVIFERRKCSMVAIYCKLKVQMCTLHYK